MTQLQEKPLVIDLDGTLTQTDTLIEQLIAMWHKNAVSLIKDIFQSIFQGKAIFKERITKNIELDPELLPYNQELLSYIHKEKKKGRKIYLATASHASMAKTIADYLGIFDGIFATENGINLKGRKKAEFLVKQFGDKGFIYAGDSKADLDIWKHSESAVVLGNVNNLKRRLQVPVVKEIPRPKAIPQILKQMRIYQWVKNLLVFVPIFASGHVTDSLNYITALTAFFAFSLSASGVYIINDLLDLESDRKHHRKRSRPFASGNLPLHIGLIVSPILFLASFGVSLSVSPLLAAIVFGYFILTTLYSVYLKTLPLVDVFTLAALYSIRIVGGGVATNILPSTWLLSFSGCLFLSLAFLKRFVETSTIEQSTGELSRRGYEVGESQIQIIMGMAAGFSSIIVFSIWLDSAAFHQTYSNQFLLWLITPLLLLWICRLWLAAFRGKMHDDPIVYTARDRVSWVIFGLSSMLYGLGLAI